MVSQDKTLSLAAGLTISGIILYFFMKKKFENTDIEADSQDYNSDSESPRQHEPFEPVETFCYYQEIQDESVPFTQCEDTTEVEQNFVNATIGTALKEASHFETNIQVEDICNNDFCSDAEEIPEAVLQTQETSCSSDSSSEAQETALEEASNYENNILYEEITIFLEKVFPTLTRQPEATQEMSSLSRINLKCWLLLALYSGLVIFTIIFFFNLIKCNCK